MKFNQKKVGIKKCFDFNRVDFWFSFDINDKTYISSRQGRIDIFNEIEEFYNKNREKIISICFSDLVVYKNEKYNLESFIKNCSNFAYKENHLMNKSVKELTDAISAKGLKEVKDYKRLKEVKYVININDEEYVTYDGGFIKHKTYEMDWMSSSIYKYWIFNQKSPRIYVCRRRPPRPSSDPH
jgi:hypothetical protein